MSTQPRRSWLRGVIGNIETTGEPVTVWQRGIHDYASDIANAQRLVELKENELESARAQLAHATANFIEHCKVLDMPIEMEPTQWPRRPYKLED